MLYLFNKIFSITVFVFYLYFNEMIEFLASQNIQVDIHDNYIGHNYFVLVILKVLSIISK